jgi:hypothetical protein
MLLGGVLTPVATGLSLQVAPLVAPLALYGVIGFAFGHWRPAQSWRWGLWIALGMVLVTVGAAVAMGIVVPVLSGGQGRSLAGEFAFVRITTLFAILPGLAGGVAGALAGAALGRRRRGGTAG